MTNFVYKKTSTRNLELFVFGGSQGQQMPGIVFFFGGGWQTGEPSQFFPQCQHFAAKGMVAAAADYRIFSRDHTTPLEALADAKSCLRWMRQNSKILGLDPSRLAAGGGSAGAHLAAACAIVDGFDDPSDDLKTPCQPSALVLLNPVINNGPEGYGYDRIKSFFPRFSPAHNVRRNLPPTLILGGRNDKIAPPDILRRFHEQMLAEGNKSLLRIYEQAEHGFFNFRPEGNPFFADTLLAMDDFLLKLGLLTSQSSSKQGHGNHLL